MTFGWIGRGSSELVLLRQLLLEGKEVTHLCLNVERQHRVSLYMPKCVYVYRVRGGAIMLCKSFGCFHFWRPAWGAWLLGCCLLCFGYVAVCG